MTHLRAVDGPGDVETYPVPLGESLAGFEYFKTFPRPIVGGNLMTLPNECLGILFRLKAHAFSTQDPGGTLPADRLQLGALAMVNSGWDHYEKRILSDFYPVRPVSSDGLRAEERLTCDEWRYLATDLWESRKESRTNALNRQRRSRVRSKIVELRGERFASEQMIRLVISALGSQSISKTNVAKALREHFGD